ncbi:proteasome protein [Intrasporangium oryzae NRRL B-24470]|uniref:Proteasome protein n=1 Tax=Intrasporangium oryzae NRRL B-24470 TaxID=1386089 RepID=W9GAI6_9MICO|nr:PAC2 family protein [Intrasporangium oryzae]EWT03196.1 proteasome protein [Intrasporangium oryzae NRRL B-24470]
MQEPTELFQFENDASPATLQDMHASVLVVALGGFIDAGHTQRLLADHILDTHESRVVASFDVDQLLDYRGRRPMMVFDRDHWSSYDDPSLLLHRVIDREGVPFLLLVGPEPDYQWARMVEATTTLIKTFGVNLTVSVHGIPMAVPHTRPLGVTAHGTNPRLVTGNDPAFGTVQVPASFSSLLEYRLGEAGHDAIGFAIHVPHYLGQTEFADAAVIGLERLRTATGLAIDVTALAATAGLNRAEITRQMEESDEITAVVRALEQQYDTFLEGRQQRSLLATDLSDLPTADEIGAEFEAFLKDVADDGSTDDTEGRDAPGDR